MTKSTGVKMAYAAALIALTLSAAAAGPGNRDNEYTYKSAQYCIPQDDRPGETRVYC
jgi:hypothetical protein